VFGEVQRAGAEDLASGLEHPVQLGDHQRGLGHVFEHLVEDDPVEPIVLNRDRGQVADVIQWRVGRAQLGEIGGLILGVLEEVLYGPRPAPASSTTMPRLVRFANSRMCWARWTRDELTKAVRDRVFLAALTAAPGV
jgi:hypothetical protein